MRVALSVAAIAFLMLCIPEDSEKMRLFYVLMSLLFLYLTLYVRRFHERD